MCKFWDQFDQCAPIDYQSNGTFNQIGQKIVTPTQDGQRLSEMGHLIMPPNRPSQFFNQDGQWLNQMGHYIVPRDRLFQFLNQYGQWFNQIKHPIMSLHVCKCNYSYN